VAKASKALQLLFESRKSTPHVKFPHPLKTFFKRFGRSHFRPFPWRDQRTSAYELLLAEVLLKQTRAEGVVPVWLKLVRKYPDPASLSKARKTDLTRLLQPLGLHRQRAAALKEIGKSISDDFSGNVSGKIQELLSIQHVGLYVASAVICFKFGKRIPIIDSNVLRVFSRITGIDFGRDIRRNRDAWGLAWAILPRQGVVAHNFGLLDFAGLICTPRNPQCTICPLRIHCVYARKRLSVI